MAVRVGKGVDLSEGNSEKEKGKTGRKARRTKDVVEESSGVNLEFDDTVLPASRRRRQTVGDEYAQRYFVCLHRRC